MRRLDFLLTICILILSILSVNQSFLISKQQIDINNLNNISAYLVNGVVMLVDHEIDQMREREYERRFYGL